MTGHREQHEDEFVDVWFGDQQASANESHHKKPVKEQNFTDEWMHQSSARHEYVPTTAGYALRKLYPKHSIVLTSDPRLNPLSFPGAYAIPLEKTPLMTDVFFVSLPKKSGGGALADSIDYAAFRVAWDKYEFLTFHVAFWASYYKVSYTFILHEGPEEPTRALMRASGLWHNELHEEIWVFNQGWWQKDHDLWVDVQKGRWEDVILNEKFKTALKKDVYGFFDAENVYKRLGIPWKRGLIMYGPPGNGKTISLKVVIKTCSEKGFSPLYVKSFQSWMGEEGAMQEVFDKARELSPCVLIMEDMDSLINDRNRSFFLNQMDGLVGNDGLLVIGTTNHFDRLDPGLSGRPSRFDRKYLFDDPDRNARILYAQYWQEKLKNSEDIVYPDSLVYTIADSTSGFSFAYLKEAFVSALVILAGTNDLPFEDAMKEQIKELRKALDKAPKDDDFMSSSSFTSSSSLAPQQTTNNAAAEMDMLRRKLASLDMQDVNQRLYTATRLSALDTPHANHRQAGPERLTYSQAQRVSPGSLYNSPPAPRPAHRAEARDVLPPAPRVSRPAPTADSLIARQSSSDEQTPISRTATSFSWYRPEMHGAATSRKY